MFPLLWQYKDEVKTMAQAFFGGVHPNDMKAATNEKAIEQLQAPAQVVIPMSMHFGAPCTPTVSKGDYVKLGQKIGEFKGLGAPIHASPVPIPWAARSCPLSSTMTSRTT